MLSALRRLVRKLVRKHGSRKGEWGRNPKRGGGGGLDVEARQWCAPGTSARQWQCWGVANSEFAYRPPQRHYLVLLQHWCRLRWVHLCHVGNPCMWTPQRGNTLVPFVNRPFESEIHGTVNFTQFCCVLLVTWCYRVLLSCYLRPK